MPLKELSAIIGDTFWSLIPMQILGFGYWIVKQVGNVSLIIFMCAHTRTHRQRKYLSPKIIRPFTQPLVANNKPPFFKKKHDDVTIL